MGERFNHGLGGDVERYYFDHAANHPLRPGARRAMDLVGEVWGNPSAIHTAGRRARQLLEESRESLAAALKVLPSEIVFTSGGTEANNLAVLGGVPRRSRLAVSAVEHPSVGRIRERRPELVEVIAVDSEGLVRVEDFAAVVKGVEFASVMWVNNETGVIQPVAELAGIAREAGVRFHVDAVQALGHAPLDLGGLGADLVSLSAHKVGGPVGIGALVVRRGVRLGPPGFGGGQEARVRSGTPAVALAVGFAAAVAEASAELSAEADRLASLKAGLIEGLLTVPGVALTSAAPASPAILHVVVEGVRADDVLLVLDGAGIDCSTGSACTAGVHQPSEVLLAMGRTEDQAAAGLRFSLGRLTSEEGVAALLRAFPAAVAAARAAY